VTESPQHAAWCNRPAHDKHLSFAEWLRNAPGRAAGSPVAPDSLRSPAKSKYRAQRTGKYASKREAQRARELSMMQQAGMISGLQEQVWFELTPKRGRLRESSYVADFVYMQDGKQVVEDCKGMQTPVYKLKRKLMLHFHNIEILET